MKINSAFMLDIVYFCTNDGSFGIFGAPNIYSIVLLKTYCKLWKYKNTLQIILLIFWKKKIREITHCACKFKKFLDLLFSNFYKFVIDLLLLLIIWLFFFVFLLDDDITNFELNDSSREALFSRDWSGIEPGSPLLFPVESALLPPLPFPPPFWSWFTEMRILFESAISCEFALCKRSEK